MNDTMADKILTILVSFNGAQWLGKCLSSLEQSITRTDILVVDNASSDESVKTIKEQFPKVQCIQLKQNKGFGAANNVGLKIAFAKQYDFVFLLNQDAYVAADCLSNLIRSFQKNPDYSVLSPWQYAYEGIKNETYFNDYVLKEYCQQAKILREENDMAKTFEASFVHAAAWFMPIDTVETIGGFDPLFFYTGEDNDYVQRLHFQNKKIGIVPAAVVYHKGTNTAMIDAASNKQLFGNTILLKLKLPEASSKGSLALFAKNAFTSHLKSKKKAATQIERMQANVYRSLTKRIATVIGSRAEQLKKQAYL